MTVVRAACLQMRLAASPHEAAERALAMAGDARARGAELALLPEYWFLPTKERPPRQPEKHSEGAARGLERISREHGMTVAGNVLQREDGALRNVLLVYDRGALVGGQAKLHPMPTEETWGVQPARDVQPFRWRDARVGGVVCADVLHPEGVRILALRGAEVLLVPVMSWLKPNDAGREARKAMFVARAYDNACFVLKCGSVGPRGPGQLVGRSLISAPWGLLAEAKDEQGEEIVLADLDLERVREERKRSLSLPRRRPEAYAALLEPVARAETEPAEDGPSMGL